MPRGLPGDSLDAREPVTGERVTISSLPMSGEAAISARLPVASSSEMPARWVERLLVLSTTLPVDEGDAAVFRAVIDALATTLPDHAIGACVVPEGGGPREVMRRAHPAAPAKAHAHDPIRLFPGFAHERILAVDGASTLHVAADDGACAEEGTRVFALATQALAVLQRGLEHARAHARGARATAELRSMHAHVTQTEKLASLGQIAAGVVHELNNPLTSILAYTDYLLKRAGLREPADGAEIERLNRIADSASRMLRFTRDLVSYARPAREIPVHVSAHTVIDQALAFCEHVLHEADVAVERRYSPLLPLVRGKPEQLAQVFVNLVTNACHAMSPSGGTLSITTRAEAPGVVIEVEDDGVGIRPEHLAHVFTPFFTTKGNHLGTGLGLAIVKSIVEQHAGTIDVTSEPAKGTRFTIRLPV